MLSQADSRREGIRQLENGNFESASRIFSNLITETQNKSNLDESVLDARGYYGQCLLGLGRPTDAAEYHRETLRVWPICSGSTASVARTRVCVELARSLEAQYDDDNEDALISKHEEGISLLETAYNSSDVPDHHYEPRNTLGILESLAEIHSRLGEVFSERRKTDSAGAHLHEAATYGKKALDLKEHLRMGQVDIISTKYKIAVDLYGAYRWNEAKRLFGEVLDKMQSEVDSITLTDLDFDEPGCMEYYTTCKRQRSKMSVTRWKQVGGPWSYVALQSHYLYRKSQARSNWIMVYRWFLFKKSLRAVIVQRRETRTMNCPGKHHEIEGLDHESLLPPSVTNLSIEKVYEQCSKLAERARRDSRLAKLLPEMEKNLNEMAHVQFFDSTDTPANSTDQESEQWLSLFENFSASMAIYASDDDAPEIKVAILDTGIDANHPFIAEKWKRDNMSERGYRDFTTEERDRDDRIPRDDDGHGTHYAGLLLKFAPKSSLFVARVARSRETCLTDEYFKLKVAQVSLDWKSPTLRLAHSIQAMKHAIEVWKVDIISMSFGIDREETMINDWIKLAYQCGILIFAAAANSGAQRSIAYPASHLCVFCIHACNGAGKPAEFTPPARLNCDNFGILGVSVPSTWPNFEGLDVPKSPRSSNVLSIPGHQGTWKYASGTSMATPMAASLAAVILLYLKLDGSRYDQFNHLDPHQKIRRIFKGMSQSVGGYESLVPWTGINERFSNYWKISDFRNAVTCSLRENP
ncbi:peptidase S8/S53 domain-containing protein [Massariosphaeria phaeospora]|uniref:Peptidase S8/S53 domain-containing protein n=1 Tax=Massariosphaeria phaeospora TaxID=100035 RepID=A0A7C8I003_9PLEO|nr:peptidase S8/S53 domain-containing protein [Massariosphaeria phaeospora]